MLNLSLFEPRAKACNYCLTGDFPVVSISLRREAGGFTVLFACCFGREDLLKRHQKDFVLKKYPGRVFEQVILTDISTK